MMTAVCLALFLNLDGERNAVNVKDVIAIEDNKTETKLYMSRGGLSLRTAEKFDNVVQKLKDTAAGCKL